ncbi:hypothetical protein DMC30DRAFT_401003 [Rhodotorula diobovata]|uniref:Uncharacterized protein n=1 Tax=Rhodotorula diobovata TaxID=5288 RepID=A0A5C5FR02_9BASI|nr:hypothetical protein DMC30DRAFT_401003 [Rhodotorula diobovata]
MFPTARREPFAWLLRSPIRSVFASPLCPCSTALPPALTNPRARGGRSLLPRVVTPSPGLPLPPSSCAIPLPLHPTSRTDSLPP